MEKLTKEFSKTKNTKSKIDEKKDTKIKATSKKIASKDTTKPISSKTKVSKTSLENKSTSKASTKKNNSKKVPTTKKTTTKTSKSTTRKKLNSQPKMKINILEYYDLPYRYNQTVVKLLFQTPKTLFVYWDITDDDRNRYIEEYGQNFFYNTRPVLIVHNETKNYTFELDINDFANSWYLTVPDADCKYIIELGRRPNNQEVQLPNNYLYIASSNMLDSPNDKILFESPNGIITYKNAKTHKLSTKNFGSITFMKNLSNMSSLYAKLYNNEFLDEFKYHSFKNPSSDIR